MTRAAEDILGVLVEAIADAVAKRLAENKPQASPTPTEWMNIPEAAAYLKIKKKTLEGYRARGEGPVSGKVGRSVRYRRSDLDAYMSAGRAGGRS